MLVDDTGRIHLFLMNDRNTGVFRVPGEAAGAEKAAKLERRIDVWRSRSNPDLTAWEALKKIWEGYTGSINSAIQTSAGRIILPFAYLTERHFLGFTGRPQTSA